MQNYEPLSNCLIKSLNINELLEIFEITMCITPWNLHAFNVNISRKDTKIYWFMSFLLGKYWPAYSMKIIFSILTQSINKQWGDILRKFLIPEQFQCGTDSRREDSPLIIDLTTSSPVFYILCTCFILPLYI